MRRLFLFLSIAAATSYGQLSDDFFAEGTHAVDTSVEALTDDDVKVIQGSLTHRFESGDWSLSTTLGYNSYEIDYAPAIGGFFENRTEETISGGLSLGYQVNQNLSLTAGIAGYQGFSDYRSLWIATFYEQAFGAVPGFTQPDPNGVSGALGVVWDFDPGVHRLSVDLGYSRDTIVPAFDRDPNSTPIPFSTAINTRDVLFTPSATIRLQSAINGSLRTQQTLRLRETTDRSLRTQLESAWVWAATDELTFRFDAGLSTEDPEFEAYYTGLTVAYDITPTFEVFASGRLYRDSGEINSANFNTAAPALDTFEISAGIAYRFDETAVRLSVGHYSTDYEAVAEDNRFFENLYSDRDFVVTRLAVTHAF